MTHVMIRSATEADATAIASIHVHSWRDTYRAILDSAFLEGPIETERLGYWSEKLKAPLPGQIIQVAEADDGELIGFVCADCDVDPQLGSRIDHLHVLADMRGRRIGEQLLRRAASLLSTKTRTEGLHLWVFEANERAIRP